MFGRKKKELKRIVDVINSINDDLEFNYDSLSDTDIQRLETIVGFWISYILIKFGDGAIDVNMFGTFSVVQKSQSKKEDS